MEKWEALGSIPKVVTILREGYTLPFQFRPKLTRSPTVISKYVNPQRQSHLLEALYQLTNKNALEPAENQNSLGFYNQLFLVPKPNNRWRPILDLSTLNTFLNTESFKIETPETIRTSLQLGEWVTSIEFKDAYFHIPIHSQSRKYIRFHIQGRSYQFKALPFGLSTAPMEFTVVAKEVKLMALQRVIRIHQYLDDWLAGATSNQISYTDLGSSLSRLCRGLVKATEKPPRSTSYETHTVALEKQLDSTRITRKGNTCSQVAPPPPKAVAGGNQCSSRSTITPTKTCSADIYRCIKRRCSLKRTHCNGNLVSSRKQVAHKSLGTKSGLSGLKRVPRPLCKQHSPGSHRQHNSGCLYQQRGGMKSGSLCALLWRILSWCTRKQVTLKARHIPGRLNVIADKRSRLGQTIQTEWSLHPEVFKAMCSRWHQPQVDLFATRFNNKLPQVVSPVPDPQAWAVDALSLSWENLDPYAFPPAAILGKVVKLQDYPCNRIILIAPGWPIRPWFWDLVAMSSQIPLCLPNLPSLVTQPFNQTLHRESIKPEPICLAPRATAIKEQGFSEAVAARIEAPQRGSTRSIYEAKWTIFTKWCLSNQVDFRAPPLKAIADFLLYLFQDRKLQPGTIDGYRSAIADK